MNYIIYLLNTTLLLFTIIQCFKVKNDIQQMKRSINLKDKEDIHVKKFIIFCFDKGH